MKAQLLNSDTFVVSKDGLPLPTEIRILQPRGAMNYQ